MADSRTDLALRVRLQGPPPMSGDIAEEPDLAALKVPMTAAREGRIG